jgi:hypothetical protein
MQTTAERKQPSMYSTSIHQAEGILESFELEKMLKVGNTQWMLFVANSEGPFWMIEAQRNSTRLGRHTDNKKTKKCARLQLNQTRLKDGRDVPQGRVK